MFTDSHCHLNFSSLADNLTQVLAEMKQAKVTRALCISCTMEDFPQVHKLALDYEHLWATVGVHPDTEGLIEPTLEDLIEKVKLPKVIGIGETGLDYFGLEDRKGGRTIADLEWQRQRFRTHIKAAKISKKPLIIHTRDSAKDTLQILKEENGEKIGGVFHCFTENVEIAKQVLDLGFYVSISGIVTFKNAKIVQEVAKFVPMDKLLIETDSPYLAPVPYRGKINSPAYVSFVAQKIAELKNLSVEKIAEFTNQNFDNLFGFNK